MVLDQLINDIRKELCLWSLPQKSEEQKDAWRRVARKNRLTAVEVQLIFRELTKKYKEEKAKPSSTWNLFGQLKFLDGDEISSTNGLKAQSPIQKPAQQTSDDDIYVELLEVREEDDFTDDESNSKSKKAVTTSENNESGNKLDCSPTTSTLTNEKKTIVVQKLKRRLTNAVGHSDDTEILQPPEKQMKNTEKLEKKTLSTPTSAHLSNGNELNIQSSEIQSNMINVERKSMETIPTNNNTGYDLLQPLELQSIKIEEPDDDYPPLTFSNDIIYKEPETKRTKNKRNDDDEETTVSKNSRAYNSFGQYVANTLNSLPEKLASQLEIKILEAIITVNAEKVF